MKATPLTSSLLQTQFLNEDGTVSWPWTQFFGQLVNGVQPAIPIASLPVYVSNAAARAGGLKPGQLFRTGTPNPDLLAVVH